MGEDEPPHLILRHEVSTTRGSGWVRDYFVFVGMGMIDGPRSFGAMFTSELRTHPIPQGGIDKALAPPSTPLLDADELKQLERIPHQAQSETQSRGA